MGAVQAIDGAHERQPRSAETTDFGFRSVPRGAEAGMVRAVFDSVAPRYDLMNDLMSLGIHRAWKQVFVDGAAIRARGATLLDLAGGTGDISFGWLARGGGPVVLSDINPAMLAVGAGPCAGARLRRRGIAAGRRCRAAAAAGSLRGSGVDRLRSAQLHRQGGGAARGAARAEAGRAVPLPGVLPRQVAALRPLYDAWSFRVLPLLGRSVARDEDSYRYLAESIRTFPDQETLAGMMRDGGLGACRCATCPAASPRSMRVAAVSCR